MFRAKIWINIVFLFCVPLQYGYLPLSCSSLVSWGNNHGTVLACLPTGSEIMCLNTINIGILKNWPSLKGMTGNNLGSNDSQYDIYHISLWMPVGLEKYDGVSTIYTTSHGKGFFIFWVSWIQLSQLYLVASVLVYWHIGSELKLLLLLL